MKILNINSQYILRNNTPSFQAKTTTKEFYQNGVLQEMQDYKNEKLYKITKFDETGTKKRYISNGDESFVLEAKKENGMLELSYKIKKNDKTTTFAIKNQTQKDKDRYLLCTYNYTVEDENGSNTNTIALLYPSMQIRHFLTDEKLAQMQEGLNELENIIYSKSYIDDFGRNQVINARIKNLHKYLKSRLSQKP